MLRIACKIMIFTIITIIALLLLGVVAALIHKATTKKGEPDEIVMPPAGNCATCNGEDERCEQECMMEAATKDIEYYNDEELDRYKGRASDEYTDEEAEEFSEVMLTMRPEEVKGWNRSLILRGINMPNQIKDEFIALTE